MSYDEIPFARERDPSIDFMKLQLLNTLNQLRLEILAWKKEHRDLLHELLFSNKKLNKEVTMEVATMKDRVDYLLEIAKNLLRDPNDEENREYKKFENMVVSMLNMKLIKKKKLGLQMKHL